MIYTLIEVTLFALCIYLLFRIFKGFYAEPEPFLVEKKKLRTMYKEEYGVDLTDEQLNKGIEMAAQEYEISTLSATFFQLTFLPFVVIIVTIAMGFSCTNYYCNVTKVYTIYILGSSVVLAVAFILLAIFLEKDKTYKTLLAVMSTVIVAYLYFFMSFLSVSIGNLLYSGQEEVLTFRVERSRFSSGKHGARTYYLETSLADDSVTRLKPLSDDQISVPDRYTLAFTKHWFAPIIQYFEKPAFGIDIKIPDDFLESRCEGNSDKVKLETIDRLFPMGSLIGLKARKAYFGEVMAKKDFENGLKITIDKNGKQSYFSLDE